ncbi:type II toxin-antitoxin system VapC family toxin [Aquamicrobium sp. LC103]|uniref:type II toxin-antitoxin system VapC family toxin n=1 Tax=Aquamicrobium sp. LC103 TaxID=1120658 RepID=UPI00063E97FC|nr:type II toxin-antitoxin system VapC family toxin [Aquamicrobium sp. LC103]TKT75349.1 type II toxin-antitoxin system VapC family toxin [Aquamicrobium sp. LC103]
MIVLDTNVVSSLMRPEENPLVVRWLDAQPRISIWITTITILEIRFGLLVLPDGRRRAGLLERFDLLLSSAIGDRILPFDRSAAEQSARISAIRRSVGRQIDLADTQIAGIVISRNATLATHNVKDFNDLDIELFNPWQD